MVSRFLKYRIRILGQLAGVSEQSDGRAVGDKGPSSVNQVPGSKEPERERVSFHEAWSEKEWRKRNTENKGK